MSLRFNAYAQIQEWGDCVVDGVPTLKCLEIVFQNILFMASTFVIIVLFAMFIIGSFLFLTSGGNPERVKKAQSTILYAVIGFALFMGAYLILTIIDIMFLGGEGKIFKFSLPEF